MFKVTLRCAGLLVIFSAYFSPINLAQSDQIITKSIPITLNETFQANKLWSDPLNMIDGDLNTYSSPLDFDSMDDDGYYYNLYFNRLYDSHGELLDKNDYGTIVKVQIKIVYGLFEGLSLLRFSNLEVEGLAFRLGVSDASGTGVENRVTEIVDVTSALKDWSFSATSQWDELLLHFSDKNGSLNWEMFRIYDVQLLVTFIQK